VRVAEGRIRPDREDMVTMRPQPRRFIRGMQACAIRKGPVRSTASVRFQISIGMVSTVGFLPSTRGRMPALFSRMSTPPKSASAAATVAATESGSATSRR
jgi:hypothetical protein